MNQKNNTVKRKKWQHISERERIEIELLYKEGYKAKDIARALGRDRRTIERELKKGMKSKKILNPYVSRNPNVPDYLIKTFYEAKKAQDYANKQKMFKGRPVKIAQDKELMDYIETLIADEHFSPDAVIGQIKAKGLKFSTMICTKTVYNMIDRGDFYRITNKNLPVKRNKKPRKHRKIHKVARNNKKGRSIELRPAEIDERKTFGHWEMDLVVGRGKSCLLVLTERMIRLEMIFKIPNKSQASVIGCINTLEAKYGADFPKMFKTITMDNGNEFLDQQGIESSCLKAGAKRTMCYYAHPYSSWERGSNENANKLIRRFIPKGSNIDNVSEEQIQEIENWMNNYPRKLHKYLTAMEVYENIAEFL